MTMALHNWTSEDIPDQTGKLVVVTGANSGLGYQTAWALAGKGARVVLAVRDEEKGRAAAEAIQRAYPRAQVEVMALDLAALRGGGSHGAQRGLPSGLGGDQPASGRSPHGRRAAAREAHDRGQPRAGPECCDGSTPDPVCGDGGTCQRVRLHRADELGRNAR